MLIRKLLEQANLVPVVTVNELPKARKIIQALVDGGITVIEIVLRTPNALAILADLVSEFKQCSIGAGTVIKASQFERVKRAGAQFAISPGCTDTLIRAAQDQNLPYLPGVSSVSDILKALEQGIDTFKLFPAEIAGGVALLKNFAAILPEVKFCPTGGINLNNLALYWQQKNVIAIGGSWLIREDDIQQENWTAITKLAQQSLSLLQSGVK